jgi:hypothetical protein
VATQRHVPLNAVLERVVAFSRLQASRYRFSRSLPAILPVHETDRRMGGLNSVESDQSILPSNVHQEWDEPRDTGDQRESFADLIVGGSFLGILVSVFVMGGHYMGGPLPSLRFWLTLAPLQAIPLLILLGLLLVPGGIGSGPTAGWRMRGVLALVCGVSYALTVALLNWPSVVAR